MGFCRAWHRTLRAKDFVRIGAIRPLNLRLRRTPNRLAKGRILGKKAAALGMRENTYFFGKAFVFLGRRLFKGHFILSVFRPPHRMRQGICKCVVDSPVNSLLITKLDLTFLGMDIDINRMGIHGELQHGKRKP